MDIFIIFVCLYYSVYHGKQLREGYYWGGSDYELSGYTTWGDASEKWGIAWIRRLCLENTCLEGEALGEVAKLRGQNYLANIDWVNIIKAGGTLG